MRKISLLLLLVLAINACKKTSDVKPKDPAQAVAGRYTLTSFRYASGSDVTDLPKLPYTQNGNTVSGTVELTANSTDEVKLVLTLNVTGKKPETFNLDPVSVQKRSEAWGLYVDNDLVADADGDNLIFNFSDTDPDTGEEVELKFVAKK